MTLIYFFPTCAAVILAALIFSIALWCDWSPRRTLGVLASIALAWAGAWWSMLI